MINAMEYAVFTKRLRSVDDPHFAECWALYESAFPPEERRTLACHAAAMAEQGKKAFHCMRLEYGIAFAGIAFYWQTPQFIYVEHLAIAPELRGKGIGHLALDFLCEQRVPLILEIEPVEDAATERRWRFYRSASFHRLPFHHVQPVYRRGDAPMRLELLSYPHAMSAAEVAAYETFMQEVVANYTEDGPDKP